MRGRIGRIFLHIILIITAISCIFPLIWMFATALKSRSEVFTNQLSLIPESWQWSNFRLVWEQADMSVYFMNSIFYTVVIVGSIAIVASLAAYGFARLDFKGKNFFFYLFLGSMLIPVPGYFIPLYRLILDLGLVNTRIGYILPLISGGLAISIFILKGFFESLPRELEEAAIIDGCGKFRIYWNIMLPVSRPVIATVVILNVLSVWNEFLMALLLFTDETKMPLQRGLLVFQGQYITQYELLMAATTIATIPVILLYITLQRHIISGLTSGGIKG